MSDPYEDGDPDPFGPHRDPFQIYAIGQGTPRPPTMAEMMNQLQSTVQVPKPPVMNTAQTKQLYDAMIASAPMGTQAAHVLTSYLARTNGQVTFLHPSAGCVPELGLMAWAIMCVPYFSEKVLTSQHLSQFVSLLEIAQLAYSASSGSTKFSTIITDNVIGL